MAGDRRKVVMAVACVSASLQTSLDKSVRVRVRDTKTIYLTAHRPSRTRTLFH
jgi:hypothetical protein